MTPQQIAERMRSFATKLRYAAEQPRDSVFLVDEMEHVANGLWADAEQIESDAERAAAFEAKEEHDRNTPRCSVRIGLVDRCVLDAGHEGECKL